MRALVNAFVIICLACAATADAQGPSRTVAMADGLSITTGWLDAARCTSPGDTFVHLDVGGSVFAIPSLDVRRIVVEKTKQNPEAGVLIIQANAGCAEAPLPVESVDFDRNDFSVLLEVQAASAREAVALIDVQNRAVKAARLRNPERFLKAGAVDILDACFVLPSDFLGCSGVQPIDGKRQFTVTAVTRQPDKLQDSGAPVSARCVLVSNGDADAALRAGKLIVRAVRCSIADTLKCKAQFRANYPAEPPFSAIEPALAEFHDYFNKVSGGAC